MHDILLVLLTHHFNCHLDRFVFYVVLWGHYVFLLLANRKTSPRESVTAGIFTTSIRSCIALSFCINTLTILRQLWICCSHKMFIKVVFYKVQSPASGWKKKKVSLVLWGVNYKIKQKQVSSTKRDGCQTQNPPTKQKPLTEPFPYLHPHSLSYNKEDSWEDFTVYFIMTCGHLSLSIHGAATCWHLLLPVCTFTFRAAVSNFCTSKSSWLIGI